MCIIVYKPEDLELPSISTLFKCYNFNPHGAGFCIRTEHGVEIRKGFMTFQDFTDALEIASKRFNLKQKDVVFHFRLATQGSINPQNCHPFPVTFREKELRELSINADMAVAHNGIILFCGYEKKMSDTMAFIRDYLAFIKDHVNDQIINELIYHATDSKFAIMTTKKVNLIGSFIQRKEDGCFYSNYSYYKNIYVVDKKSNYVTYGGDDTSTNTTSKIRSKRIWSGLL